MMNQWLKTPNLGQMKQTNKILGKIKSLHFSHYKGTIDYEIGHYLLYSISRPCREDTYQLSASRRCPKVVFRA